MRAPVPASLDVSAEADARPAERAPPVPTGTGGLPVPSPDNPPIAVSPQHPAAPWHGAVERRRRISLGWLSFVIVVILPVGLAGVYYGFLAADQYVAEFRFALRSAEPVREPPDALFRSAAVPERIGRESSIVVQYIVSRAAVDDLGKTLDLRAMFATDKADWPARLHLPVSAEGLVAYWKGQVDAFFDATNGTIVVRVRAFTPQEALLLAQRLVAASERLVNQLSARARQNRLHDSEQQVELAEKRLSAALARLREFRDRQGLIDPHRAAEAAAALEARVGDDLVRANTELATLKQYMREDAPPVQVLEARIRSLEAQRRKIEAEATATPSSPRATLSSLMGGYEELESERRFAEDAYQHALEALDRARLNADRQQVYIASFVAPSLPEEALYPHRARALGIVFLIALAVWAIGSLTLHSVRDHL